MIAYAICSTNRTGSTLLCCYMMDTGLVGYPVDYSSQAHLDLFLSGCEARKPLTTKRIDELIKSYSTGGVFGIKIPYFSFQKEIQNNALSDLFPIQPKYIYITREDKIKQAVSMARAFQTGRHYSFQKTKDVMPLQYIAGHIRSCLEEIEKESEIWEDYFTRNGINPLRVTYEELDSNSKKTVVNVLEYIGVTVPAGFRLPPARLKKQADKISAEWEVRYKAEVINCD